jgi:FKBP-type peptidyl-prolyl cis-trans isomerase
MVLGLAMLANPASASAASPQRAATYDSSAAANARFLADFAALKGVVKLPDGLMYRVLESGSGTSPISRYDTVTVEYLGWTIDGKIFDRTKPDAPRTFQVGNVIPGWREALFKMKAGDEWQIVVPSDLGYGDAGVEGFIPPDQTLVFRVRLLKVEYAP